MGVVVTGRSGLVRRNRSLAAIPFAVIAALGTSTEPSPPVPPPAAASPSVPAIPRPSRTPALNAASTPGAPIDVAAAAGNGAIAVSWLPNPANPDGTVTYLATANPGGFQCATTADHCTITELANDTPYTVTVSATNGTDSSTEVSAANPEVPGSCVVTASPQQPLSAFRTSLINGSVFCSGTVTPVGSVRIGLTATDNSSPTVASNGHVTRTGERTGTFSVPITSKSGGPATLAGTVVHPTVGTIGIVELPVVVGRVDLARFAGVPKSRSERSFTAIISTTAPDHPVIGSHQTPAITGLRVIATVTEGNGGGVTRTWKYGTTTNPRGQAAIPLKIWKNATIKVDIVGNRTANGATLGFRVRPTAAHSPALRPFGSPQPTVPWPNRPRALGAGANAQIAPISGALWSLMRGRSWNSNCVGPSSLRLLNVNYWGFDGFRYRGEMVVRDDAAPDFAAIFTDFYNIGYPIRQIVLPDRFGPNINGWPGANDYAQMAADNTSVFNCRYVVGKEDAQVMSPHASGRAIDINTWENPYAAPTGYFPNTWFMFNRPLPHTGVLDNRALGALTGRGFFWGGWWGAADYQHFQR